MCGSKASAKVVLRDKFVWLEGPCMSCKKNLETNLGRQDDLDLSRIVNHLSPRAIPIPLLLSRDLGVNCYASGTGGIGYLVDGSIVAKKLGLKFPLVTVWASKDRYVGIGQLPVLSESATRRDFEAELASLRKLSEICHAKIVPLLASRDISMKDGSAAAKLLAELFSLKEEQRKIRQQISAVAKSQNIARLAPCFIDYAVNFGIKATEDNWANHLQKDGRLATPVEFPNRQ
jgi:hypothetical protein